MTGQRFQNREERLNDRRLVVDQKDLHFLLGRSSD
jgi:hypothetical protein